VGGWPGGWHGEIFVIVEEGATRGHQLGTIGGEDQP
jgi:hypothetical protein